MELDLYQRETARIAEQQTAVLDEVQQRLIAGQTLSRLEQNGVLHALQLLVENSIGKAKQLLKVMNKTVPVSAYDAFSALMDCRKINADELEQWNLVIGLRNRIVHDYMNINMDLMYQMIIEKRYLFMRDFLMQAFEF